MRARCLARSYCSYAGQRVKDSANKTGFRSKKSPGWKHVAQLLLGERVGRGGSVKPEKHESLETSSLPRLREALARFERLCIVEAEPRTYASFIKECTKAKALEEGKRVHRHISRCGLGQDNFLGNLLVEMYGKCGQVKIARSVFDNISKRNVFTWTLMILAYVQNGLGKEALKLFHEMQQGNVDPDNVTFLTILEACSSPEALAEGRLIHGLAMEKGLHSDVLVANAIISMYSNCGRLKESREIFDEMPEWSVASWNAIIAAYGHHGHAKEALNLFRQMHEEGMYPTCVVFVSVLNACTHPSVLAEGKLIHVLIVYLGLESNVSVGNALTKMYSKCGSLEDACGNFNRIQVRDVFSWNFFIEAYACEGYHQTAIRLFHDMEKEKIKANKSTLLEVLEICANTVNLVEGQQIHALIDSQFDMDVDLGNALMNLYGKCGRIVDARKVFDEMVDLDIVSWNALMAMYKQQHYDHEALEVFRLMELKGINRNNVTYVTALDVCSSSASFEVGRNIHVEVVERGMDNDLNVQRALINMYRNCGKLEDLLEILNSSTNNDIVIWNVIIILYSQGNCLKQAIQLLQQMQDKGVQPEAVTLVATLDSCMEFADIPRGKFVHAFIMECAHEVDNDVRKSMLKFHNIYCEPSLNSKQR